MRSDLGRTMHRAVGPIVAWSTRSTSAIALLSFALLFCETAFATSQVNVRVVVQNCAAGDRAACSELSWVASTATYSDKDRVLAISMVDDRATLQNMLDAAGKKRKIAEAATGRLRELDAAEAEWTRVRKSGDPMGYLGYGEQYFGSTSAGTATREALDILKKGSAELSHEEYQKLYQHPPFGTARIDSTNSTVRGRFLKKASKGWSFLENIYSRSGVVFSALATADNPKQLFLLAEGGRFYKLDYDYLMTVFTR